MARGWPRSALLAGAAAGGMALTAVLTAAFAFGTDTTALIMGDTGMPIPLQSYVDAVNDRYLHCADLCTPQALVTPEGLYPVTGDIRLPLDTSMAQGVALLNDAIEQQLAEGRDVTVFGFSQSATIASLEMGDILNGSAGIDVDPGRLSFVLTGDPSNPNGGMLERFDLPAGSLPSIPSLGITFSGATPVTEYPTEIYTGEYDGFADFPRYPIDFLSDLNALFGVAFVHPTYPGLTPGQLASAVTVPTSAGYDGATTYYMIPTEYLPLLDPVRAIPVVGPVVADLLQPDLTVLVNLGYGNPDYGWVNEDANVPTPMGLFPSASDVEKVPGLLAQGTQQGIHDAIHDLENPARLFALADNPFLAASQNLFGSALLSEDGLLPAEAPPPTLPKIVEALIGASLAGYATLPATADIADALITTTSAYDTDIFLSELAEGNLLGAIYLPIAADLGILPMAEGFALATIGEAALAAALYLASPFVDVASLT